MMYIFEGIDGAGKDTLIAKIKQTVSIPVFNGFNVYDQSEFTHIHPFVGDKKEWQKAIGFEIVNYCKQAQYSVIINRFTWSEIVYSKVLRNQADTAWYWDIMEKELQGIAKIIYVDVTAEEAEKRIKKSGRHKSKLVLSKLNEMRKEFWNLIETTKLPVVLINSMTLYDNKSYLDDPRLFREVCDGILYKNDFKYGSVIL